MVCEWVGRRESSSGEKMVVQMALKRVASKESKLEETSAETKVKHLVDW